MKKFDLKKFIAENKATFYSSLSENKIEEMIDADQSITTEEAFKIAEKFADYMTKFYGIGDQEWTVVRGSVNGPKFDLALDGDRNKGGSYVISTSGNIINVAADNVVHAKYNKTIDTLSSPGLGEAKKSKKYYKDAEADDAEHIKALEKDMKDDKKASKKLKEDMSRYFTSPPKTPTALVDRIISMYPKMKWLKDELPGWFNFKDIEKALEDAGYGKVYDEFMGGDMGGRMTDLNETNTKMKKSDLKAKIKEMIVAEMTIDMEDTAKEDDFLAEIAAMLDESPMNDPRTAQIIQMLRDMDVDGETMEYILRQVGMEDQMANQLVNYPAEYAASLKEMELFPLVGNEDYDKGDHFFDIVADTKFEDALYAFKKEGFTLEDITGWIEAHWNRINEAEETEKDTAEVDTTDVTVDDTETTDVETTAEVDPNVKAVQDSLTQAQAAAQALGDKKLIDQIGNTITFFTRAHVVEKPKAVAEIESLKERLLLQKKAGIITEAQYQKKVKEAETSDVSPEQAVDKAMDLVPKLEKSPELDKLADKIAKDPNLLKQLEKALAQGGIMMNEELEKLDNSDLEKLALNLAKKADKLNETISSNPEEDTSSAGLGMLAFAGGGTLGASFSSAIASAIPAIGTVFAGPAVLGALAGVGLFILARKVYLKMNPDA